MTAPTPNSQEFLTPSRAYTYLGEPGTVAPVDAAVDLDPDWVYVGYTTPDSLSFNTEPEFAEVQSHQSDFPTKRMQTSESATVSVDLQQWNAGNIVAVYGGGAVVEVGTTGTGNFKFTPPRLGGRAEKSAIVEVVDGTKHYRWIFPRVMQIEGVSAELQKGQEARLPLRLAVLGDDSADPFYLLTDDPAFAPAA